jgi:hypothetical protein
VRSQSRHNQPLSLAPRRAIHWGRFIPLQDLMAAASPRSEQST